MTQGNIQYAKHENIYVVKLTGDVRFSECAGLDELLNQVFEKADFDGFVIDLTEADLIDSTTLGVLSRVAIYFRQHMGYRPIILYQSADIGKTLKSVSFDSAFALHCLGGINDSMSHCPSIKEEEQSVAKRVLKAHENLIELDEKNQSTFQDVVELMQKECDSE